MRLEKMIEEEYRDQGYRLGWRFLYSPPKVLNAARVAFIGLNPGGRKPAPQHAKFAMTSGSAYTNEVWKNSSLPGGAPLQQQAQKLFQLIGVPAEDVLAGNLVPFRSPSWGAFPKQQQKSALNFGGRLWGQVLKKVQPEIVISFHKEVTETLSKVLNARNEVKILVNWGVVKGSRSVIPGGILVGLPHLSIYKIIGRAKSEEAVKSLLGLN